MYYMLIEEIRKVITDAGITPDQLNLGQLSQAVKALPSGRLLSISTFTASGTWTKPVGCNSVVVEVCGGGAGGGGVIATGAGHTICSVGGGGGGYAMKRITTPGATEVVTVGAGGAGGNTGGSNGAFGGTSSFGGWCSATGGVSGTGVSIAASSNYLNGVSGGNGSGGTINIPGQASADSAGFAVAPNGIASNGGSSRFGSGGIGTLNNEGLAATGYGGGGGGVQLGALTPGHNGGAGTSGIVVVWEYA
jgi:hypothetical protein